jgi:hypothetical protein
MPLEQLGFGRFFRAEGLKSEGDSFIRRYYINIQTRFNFKALRRNYNTIQYNNLLNSPQRGFS